MKSITVQKLQLILADTPIINLIDVREPEEHHENNMGGINLPLSKISNFDFDEIEPLMNEDIYVYCRSGNRSLQACLLLEQAGYTKLTNIEGGITAWDEEMSK
jgi:rhodanese-related sulfurtransferase